MANVTDQFVTSFSEMYYPERPVLSNRVGRVGTIRAIREGVSWHPENSPTPSGNNRWYDKFR